MTVTPRISPWADELPSDLNSEQGLQVAIDRIAWRNAGRPDPSDSVDWKEDDKLSYVFGRHSHDTLEIGGLKLRQLPPQLFDMQELGYLFLSNNRLETLPPQFCERLRLEGLTLDRNPLRSVPPELFEMPGLDNLSLSGTPLIDLPVPRQANPSLKVLILDDMHWLDFPQNFLPSFPNLKSLSFSRCEQGIIPQAVFNLPDLMQLCADGNPIKVLPAQIGQLSNIQSLKLKNCELTTLPKALGQLTQLENKAGSGGPFGLHIGGNPFKDKDLKRIAKLKNPAMTTEALAWARDNGSD